jgi:hypothetical protein
MEASAPDIIRLFPTFVWWRRLEQECYEPLDRDLMAYVDTLISSGGGTRTGATWQSGHQQHNRPEFAVLIAHIERAVRDVLTFLKVADTRLTLLDAGSMYWIQAGHMRCTAIPTIS